MRAVRIRCVRAVDRGRVEPRRAFRRAFLYTALLLIGTLYHFQAIVNPDHHQTIENGKHAAIVLLLALPHYADLLWVSWDKKNQTLHDKFAQTIVIREPKVAS
jgi:uncharacterized RDD family membrane protein YckC